MNPQAFYIPVILGTVRAGRQSEAAARVVLEEAKKRGHEAELIDLGQLNIPPVTGGEPPKDVSVFAEKIKRADGVIIVSPEYNHGYPGVLKNAMDWLYEEWNHKPIGICGVSAGPLGGARMVEQLRLVSIEFKMVPIREAVYFARAQTLFDENGALLDQSLLKRIETFLKELEWWMKVTKVGKEQFGLPK